MQVSLRPQNTKSISSNTDAKSNGNKAKRKLRWKLKFHHQALPAEYLNHYEASLLPKKSEMSPRISTAISHCSPSAGNDSLIPKDTIKVAPSSHYEMPHSTVKYKDLPYMGEMTLDNARPRRGRKPKKADICHLIYKNYNTTVVEEPLNLCLRDVSKESIPNNGGVPFCKFKFKGELTPILQEKKSTSADSSRTTKLLDKSRRTRDTKHKSRKLLAREKLEKTFKERGFLIQTQQLESTQGATYCKFRQLRKFTRYLFRSWKHHLPGDVVKGNLK